MNKNFAEWYRVANIQPQHEQLQARWQGIEGFCKKEPGCSNIMDLIRLFFNLPAPDTFQEIFVESFYDADNAFPRSNNRAELSVLAGATLDYITENDICGLRTFTLLAVKSAALGREAIVPTIFTNINDLFYSDTIAIRDIETPNKISSITPTTKNLRESLKAIEDTNSWSPPNEVAKQLSTYLMGIDKAYNLLKNWLNESIFAQKVYKEDSQILWWLTGEYSKDLERPFKGIGAGEGSLVIGKELADLVETLPGPYSSKAVINKLLSITTACDEDLILSTAINQTDKSWRHKVCGTYESNKTNEITPVLAAISESLRVEKPEEWLAAYKKLTGINADSEKLNPVELSYQIYLECLLVKAYHD